MSKEKYTWNEYYAAAKTAVSEDLARGYKYDFSEGLSGGDEYVKARLEQDEAIHAEAEKIYKSGVPLLAGARKLSKQLDIGLENAVDAIALCDGKFMRE